MQHFYMRHQALRINKVFCLLTKNGVSQDISDFYKTVVEVGVRWGPHIINGVQMTF